MFVDVTFISEGVSLLRKFNGVKAAFTGTQNEKSPQQCHFIYVCVVFIKPYERDRLTYLLYNLRHS